MDKVEAIIFQGVVRFGRDVQVAVALLVTQVHLYLWSESKTNQSINEWMDETWANLIHFLLLPVFKWMWFQKRNHKQALTDLQPGRKRRTRWCRHRATSSPCEEGRKQVSSCPPSLNPAAWWSGPWAQGSSPVCDVDGWGNTLLFDDSIP